jgi:peptide/nickel transport system substrate-binding protein
LRLIETIRALGTRERRTALRASSGHSWRTAGLLTAVFAGLAAAPLAVSAAENPTQTTDEAAPSPQTAATPLLWIAAADALTLDPHATRDRFTVSLLRQFYETLVRRAPNGKLEPGLATAWQPDGNGLTWRLTLRPDVKFHDGATLTSRDVVFSLIRARGPGTAYASLLGNITSIQAEAEDTVTITTRYADPLMPLRLAAIAIMDAEWANANGLSRVTPIVDRNNGRAAAMLPVNGSGAYRLGARKPGLSTQLIRNPTWWGRAAGLPEPPATTVTHRPISDGQARIKAFETADRVFLQHVPVASQTDLRTQPAVRLRAGADNRVVFLGLRVGRKTENAGLSEAKRATLRDAIATAIDRPGLKTATLANQGLTTTVLLPTSFDGYSRALDETRQPDATAAADQLRASGIEPETVALTLSCPRQGHPDPVAVCTKLADDMKQIGLQITTVFVDRGAYYRRILNGEPDAFVFSLYDPTFDGADLLGNLFRPNARWNAFALDRPDVTTGIDALAASSDRRTRKLQFTILETQIRQANVAIPLFTPTLTYAFKGNIDMPVDALDSPELARLSDTSESRGTAVGPLPGAAVE